MPLSPSETRELLARLGHHPKRFLGQNFLTDGNIVRKSLELAGIRPGDSVVEIGPGLGTLSEALLEAGAALWAVEKDRGLHAHLAAGLATRYPGTFHLVEGDAMELPLAALPAGRQGDFKIVANLPYAISTPWMDAVLESSLPTRMVLMLQKEAADRYGAQEGSKQFGAISIFLQAAYDIEPGHRVSAACFHPRPEVDSFLLNLARKPSPFLFAPATKALIRACFQQRRKQIASLLRGRLADDGRAWLALLAAEGFPPNSRPEQIPLRLWTLLEIP